MDDALAQKGTRKGVLFCVVLILVVMDDALAHNEEIHHDEHQKGLNPCCNG